MHDNPEPTSASPVLPQTVPITAQPYFFAVSPTKFLVMCVCTFGIYEYYWFYKNWALIQERERSNIMPFGRATFAYFFCYSLFRKIRNTAKDHGLKKSLPAGLLAAGWMMAIMLCKLPDPYWLVSYVSLLFFLPVQGQINEINAKLTPGHEQNRHLTTLNTVTVIIGGILFAAVVAGSFMPAE